MTNRRAVFLGLTTLDVVQRVDARPPWGIKSVVSSTVLAAGGPAANAAVTAAALLGEATLVTGLGATPTTALCRADLEAHGVRIVDLAPPAFEVPVSCCTVEPDGTRTVLSTSALTSRLQLNDQARSAVQGADALMFDGHHPVAAGMALGLVADTDIQLEHAVVVGPQVEQPVHQRLAEQDVGVHQHPLSHGWKASGEVRACLSRGFPTGAWVQSSRNSPPADFQIQPKPCPGRLAASRSSSLTGRWARFAA